MKFSKLGASVPIEKTGPAHQSWKAQLMLEKRSSNVSLERNVRDGKLTEESVRTLLQPNDLLVTSSVKLENRDWSMPRQAAHENDIYDLLGSEFDTLGFVGSRKRLYKGKWARASLDANMRPSTRVMPPARKLRALRIRQMESMQQAAFNMRLSTESLKQPRVLQKSSSLQSTLVDFEVPSKPKHLRVSKKHSKRRL
mmetsp:Transcript_2121/g.5249  ORF Transcript_2121/g.5249 Transcript_2121/m.5249 type:complete len:197 (+) Transcript_2121:1209-1799(+)